MRVPPPYARMIAMKAEEGSRSSTIVSAAFQMGLAAYSRQRLYDVERDNALQETAAADFAAKVEIVTDEALMATFPVCYPAEVEVVAAGKTVRKRITAAVGDPSRPLDDARLKDKAERVLRQIDPALPAATLVAIGLAGFNDRSGCERIAAAMAAAME